MTLRRGFKKEANDIAREVRKELDLGFKDPLDPWKLADHLAIPVLPLRSFSEEAPGAVQHFVKFDTDAFFAVTVFRGPQRVIVHHDALPRTRQASDIAHELAHSLLLHPPHPALDHRGCRYWNAEIEQEAEWLAGALLISEEAALMIVRRGLAISTAAQMFGISKRMVNFRINVTGARTRVDRSRGTWMW